MGNKAKVDFVPWSASDRTLSYGYVPNGTRKGVPQMPEIAIDAGTFALFFEHLVPINDTANSETTSHKRIDTLRILIHPNIPASASSAEAGRKSIPNRECALTVRQVCGKPEHHTRLIARSGSRTQSTPTPPPITSTTPLKWFNVRGCFRSIFSLESSRLFSPVAEVRELEIPIF